MVHLELGWPKTNSGENKIIGSTKLSRFCNGKLAIGRVLAAVGLLASATQSSAQENFPYDATADTVFDIIQKSDPSTFVCLVDTGRQVRQMWDKRLDNEFNLNTFSFQAHFSNMAAIDIIVNPEFGTTAHARIEAERYVTALGQLPLVVRQGIRQFGIHKGTETFSAGPGKIFVYADMTTRRIGQNHLEESLFHEAVHASLDATYGNASQWTDAQNQDGTFLTDYAAAYPGREDLAETALFAYGLLYHPGRIPPVDSAVIQQSIPSRIAVMETIFKSSDLSNLDSPQTKTCP